MRSTARTVVLGDMGCAVSMCFRGSWDGGCNHVRPQCIRSNATCGFPSFLGTVDPRVHLTIFMDYHGGEIEWFRDDDIKDRDPY